MERQCAKISRSNFREWAIRVARMVRLGFYIADLTFVVCQSTAKIDPFKISGYTVAAHVHKTYKQHNLLPCFPCVDLRVLDAAEKTDTTD